MTSPSSTSDHAVMNFSTISEVGGFLGFHWFGFRKKICMVSHARSVPFLMALCIPPAVDTCAPRIIFRLVPSRSVVVSISQSRYFSLILRDIGLFVKFFFQIDDYGCTTVLTPRWAAALSNAAKPCAIGNLSVNNGLKLSAFSMRSCLDASRLARENAQEAINLCPA